MVNLHIAYTEPINPAGASPLLTREQIWQGLQRKVRRAQDFVPVIVRCDVLEDEGDVVKREAFFKTPAGEHSVVEICRSYQPTKVDFHQPDGAVITNTVSDGAGLTENDLNMTYTFEWRKPDVQAGSEEAQKLQKEYTNMAKMAVHSSIVAMRKMAEAGELGTD